MTSERMPSGGQLDCITAAAVMPRVRIAERPDSGVFDDPLGD
ncbi:hypothetical protein [Bifidobacterium callimiconis]|nr:hypothetical protein [Bifidobacterium callimiconis]